MGSGAKKGKNMTRISCQRIIAELPSPAGRPGIGDSIQYCVQKFEGDGSTRLCLSRERVARMEEDIHSYTVKRSKGRRKGLGNGRGDPAPRE